MLASQIFGLATLTLVLSPMLIASLLLAVILTASISYDVEANLLEGAALIAPYGIVATAFWWG